MLGHPKFNYNDKVMFVIDDVPVKGSVYIIDKDGIWEVNSDVYYHIMTEDETMLYKHIREDNLTKISNNI